MTRYEKIREAIDEMHGAEIVDLHNEYCDAANYPDDHIYSMEDFDEIMSGMTPWEIVRAAYYSGKFCPARGWFWFNGYGNLESDDFVPDIIDMDAIAKYIDENDDDLGNSDIADILEADEDEEE